MALVTRKQRALSAALESARKHRRLREFASLDGLVAHAKAFIPQISLPQIPRTRILLAGAFYGLAVVPPGPFLQEGDWHAGSVQAFDCDGIAILLVIEFAVIVYHHIPNGYAWIARGFEYPLFWGLLFVIVAIRGGGPYSVDRAIGRVVAALLEVERLSSTIGEVSPPDVDPSGE